MLNWNDAWKSNIVCIYSLIFSSCPTDIGNSDEENLCAYSWPVYKYTFINSHEKKRTLFNATVICIFFPYLYYKNRVFFWDHGCFYRVKLRETYIKESIKEKIELIYYKNI